ncbi:MAG TPA: acyltransferase, partial [Candidatus Binataceae bacterium]|nr:acyltransferase [Candidatus Binataceae bacterium]
MEFCANQPERVENRGASARWHSDYLPILDGWRAVAIICVLVCHCCEPIFHDAGIYPYPMLYRITRHGAIGVDIFFCISGFLICTRLLCELHRNGEISLANFYIRRAFRILPPYLAYLLVIGALAYRGVLLIHRWEWLSCLLFFRNYIAQRDATWYLGHFWSLAVEEHFYLIWPGILVLFGSRRARWAAVLMALSVAGWRTLNAHQNWISPAGGVAFYGRTDIRLDALLWGCWAALIVDAARWRSLITNSVSPVIWTAMVALLVYCVAYTPPLSMLWQAILIPLVLVGTVLRPIGAVAWILEAQAVR